MTTPVKVGQIWRDNYRYTIDGHDRYVKILDVNGDRVTIQTCSLRGHDVVKKRPTKTKLSRFNGKVGGFTIVVLEVKRSTRNTDDKPELWHAAFVYGSNEFDPKSGYPKYPALRKEVAVYCNGAEDARRIIEQKHLNLIHYEALYKMANGTYIITSPEEVCPN